MYIYYMYVIYIVVYCCQYIRQEYAGYSEDRQNLMLAFDGDMIVLDLPSSPPLIVDGWRIQPLKSLPKVCRIIRHLQEYCTSFHKQIAREDIVQFIKHGRKVPACTVELEWIGSGEPKPLSHQVKISGATKPAHFYLRYYPHAVGEFYLCTYVKSVPREGSLGLNEPLFHR